MTKNYTRRDFLQTTLAGAGVLMMPSGLKSRKPLLSFSTLGCPDWSLDTILNFASEHEYDGVELRGIKRQLNLPQCPEFRNENIQTTKEKFRNKKIKVIGLGASTSLHHADATQRKKNIDEARSFIDLAHQLDCPYVRVFPDTFPKEQEKNDTVKFIVNGLIELGDYAKSKNVMVLLETHGDVIWSADLESIMQQVTHSNVGLIWDIVNMWSVTKEPVAEVYLKLSKYIRHVHVKDLKILDDQKHQYVLLGRGDMPVFEAIDILTSNGYKGYYSFEWEKLWSPEIEEPEVAIPDYIKAMKQHFKK